MKKDTCHVSFFVQNIHDCGISFKKKKTKCDAFLYKLKSPLKTEIDQLLARFTGLLNQYISNILNYLKLCKPSNSNTSTTANTKNTNGLTLECFRGCSVLPF